MRHAKGIDVDVAIFSRQFARQQNRHPFNVALERQRTRERLASVLRNAEVDIVYQPAVRVGDRRVKFFEALARFRSTSFAPPDHWFAAAEEVGLGVELEILAAKRAIEGLRNLPEGSSVSINLSPRAIVSKGFAELLISAPIRRIILEITEQHAVASYEALIQVLAPLRQEGLRIAVDDAGAGYASFRHILRLAPDMIKLDMSICRGIDHDQVRQALVSALVTFSRQIGSDLVAEGVETEGELEILRHLGLQIVQGYLLGRPVPPEQIVSAASAV